MADEMKKKRKKREAGMRSPNFLFDFHERERETETERTREMEDLTLKKETGRRWKMRES